MDHSMDAHSHDALAHAGGHAGMNMECDGSLDTDRKGSWKGAHSCMFGGAAGPCGGRGGWRAGA